MRIRITLDMLNKKIPVNYRSLLQGGIYNCIFADENSEKIHDYGYKIDKRKFKLFTFSELYGKTEYLQKSKELLFLSSAYFEFSSIDDKLVLAITNFITQNKTFIIQKKKINILSLEYINDNDCKNTTAEFTTSSPITAYKVVEGKKTSYLHPISAEFSDSIINNLSKKYYLVYKENMPEIQIVSISNIKEKRVYFRNNFSIAYHCSIKITGLTNKIYQVILACGLGSKNSSGFGMVKKVNEKKNLYL